MKRYELEILVVVVRVVYFVIAFLWSITVRNI